MNKIEIIHKFIVGSNNFFNEFDDFSSKDMDYLCIMSRPLGNNKSFLISSRDGKDYILYPQLTKEEFIEKDLENKDSIKLGKYLCKDFIEFIGLTINDLKKLKPLYDKLDEKHEYQKVIYDSYVKNKSFKLNKRQRKKSYELYKKYRNN